MGADIICALLSISGGLTQSPNHVVLRSGKVRVELDAATGRYDLRRTDLDWRMSGDLGGPAERPSLHKGRNGLGPYHEIDFERPTFHGVIRVYDANQAIWFRAHYLRAQQGNGIEFPKLTAPAQGLHSFSYQDTTFATPTFKTSPTATPWLLFDDHARSMIISPASEFMVSTMAGSAETTMSVGLSPKLQSVPAGFDQDSVLVFADGIGAAWDAWGSTMRGLFRRAIPSNDADPILKDFGYWTDNGADYYYNYDYDLGYAKTLEKLVGRYRQEGIPLGYLQLDSWWYDKSINGPDGKPGGAKKNSKLPVGAWNRYGGLMEYTADPDLFPEGLAKFHEAVDLPLAVHNRWIDRTSPYHDRYQISGVGATDPRWWHDVAGYLKQSGVICYEQDWLDQIYLNSPEMGAKAGIGDAFTAGMAGACKQDGLDMQYCMGTPRFFLQGLNYGNLTTIRTSGDRFEPGKWPHFLYVSQLAYEDGIWPWCDVFKSGETGNMIVSVLSAGPVGTGDALGKESKENILRAVRPDGVIVKPDRPLLPCDRTYIEEANHSQAPFLASTYTEHQGMRTTYAFAFPRGRRGERGADFTLSDVGAHGPSYLYDFLRRQGRVVGADERIQATIGAEGYAYWMVAPVMHSGVALLGDLDQFVPTGRQRIVSVEDRPKGLRITVAFAKGEKNLTLTCVIAGQPSVRAAVGSGRVNSFDPTSKLCQIEVTPVPNLREAVIDIDP